MKRVIHNEIELGHTNAVDELSDKELQTVTGGGLFTFYAGIAVVAAATVVLGTFGNAVGRAATQ